MKMARLTVAINGTVTSTGDAGDGRNDGIMRLNGRSWIAIIVPTIITGTVSISVSNDPDASVPLWYTLQKADGSAALTLASGTGAVAWALDFPIPFRALKLVCGATQTTTARTFIVTAL